MGFIADFFREFWLILAESGVWLVLGLLLAGVAHVLVPSGWIERQIGGRGLWPITKASLMGIPLPLCSCSVIPVAAGLRRQGAGPGPPAAFTVSTPQTGEESIPLTWALLGPAFALTRPVVGVVTALLTGLTVSAFGRRDPERTDGDSSDGDRSPDHAGGSCCHHNAEAASERQQTETNEPACCHDDANDDNAGGAHRAGAPGVLSKSARVLRYGFGTLLDDLSHWLLLGLGLSALVAALIEPGSLSDTLGGGFGGMLLALVVGIPVYIGATSSTPLVAALIAAGVSPGAGMVLLLAGPATNLATMTWMYKDLGGRALAAYLVSIAVISLAAGWLVNLVLAGTITAAASEMHEHAQGPIAIAGGAVLGGLLAVSLVRKAVTRLRGSGSDHAGHHHEHGAHRHDTASPSAVPDA